MSDQIKAIGAYRPRIVLGRTARKKDIVRFIARSTGLNEGDIAQVLAHLRDAVIFYTLDGRAVQLDGLGTYYPKIRLDGRYSVGHRADRELKAELNKSGNFQGEIVNKDNIGKTAAELVIIWNDEHPEDTIS
jgi:nucleoid DNA-binding protein